MIRNQAVTDAFTEFVVQVEPRIRLALIPSFGIEGSRDATADALRYAWEHWDRIEPMENPAGYLYRVACTSARRTSKRPPLLPAIPQNELPMVEPGLPRALLRLSGQQRTAVWLVHGLQWKHTEVAELLGVSPDTVRTHVGRGLSKLRSDLGGPTT